MALVNARHAILERDAEAGDKKARCALDVASDSGSFLAAIQVAITLVGFFASACAATTLSEPLAAWFDTFGIPASQILAPFLITLLVSYISIVIGELVPKRIALADAEGVSKKVAGFLRAFAKIVHPLVWLTNQSANALARIFGVHNVDDRQSVSGDEIKYLVTDAEDITDEEKGMIHDIFDLGDAVAREVMTPRIDCTMEQDSTSCIEVLNLMHQTGFSRIPIYHEDMDHIVGIAHIKDLITPIIENNAAQVPIKQYIREADFVPETKDVIPLLSEMRTSHDQLVIVVDEYGGTAGIITIEDIVEEVVGEIEDEFDPDNKYITQLPSGEWLIDGRYSIDDARELGFPIPDSDEYDTLAGFILDLADSLPAPGQTFVVDDYLFRVQSMRNQRVTMVRVKPPQEQKTAQDAEQAEQNED